jgi:hypothetical protein
MQDQASIWRQNKIFGWIALATGCVLLIPLVAMQFTEEVDWRANDFVVAGALLFVAGSLLALAMRMPPRFRILRAGAVMVAFLYLYVELAVGVFTDWGS